MGDRAVALLNARPEFTRREAAIIAQAGLPGSVRRRCGRQADGWKLAPGGQRAGGTASSYTHDPCPPSYPPTHAPTCPHPHPTPRHQVTIATNVAGRGTDILLGGNPKGLVAMLLGARLLPLLAPGARGCWGAGLFVNGARAGRPHT